MADGIEFDFGEIDQLAASLGEVADDVGPNIRSAVMVTSINIKDGWREKLDGSATLWGLPIAVGFDITVAHGIEGSSIQSDIGFDIGRGQGPLGGISEFGSPTVAPRGYGLQTLLENEGDFEKGLQIAVESTERKAGL